MNRIKLLFSFLIFLNLSGNELFAVTYIKAEDTNARYIKVSETDNRDYFFEECSSLTCTPLFDELQTFTAREIDSLIHRNRRQIAYAAAGDVVLIAASIAIGWIVAAKAGVYVYAAKGFSLEGVGAASAAIYGTPSGGAVAGTTVTLIDNLDPFIHRDVSIAFKNILNIASEKDLRAVDSEDYEDGTLVVIEDLNYAQLKEKIVSQLGSTQD